MQRQVLAVLNSIRRRTGNQWSEYSTSYLKTYFLLAINIHTTSNALETALYKFFFIVIDWLIDWLIDCDVSRICVPGYQPRDRDRWGRPSWDSWMAPVCRRWPRCRLCWIRRWARRRSSETRRPRSTDISGIRWPLAVFSASDWPVQRSPAAEVAAVDTVPLASPSSQRRSTCLPRAVAELQLHWTLLHTEQAS